ncbi:hypothetical protein [Pseudomonas putida]|uniref:hypothetical protein n=1 Tax=Pseudomonas putida TaxID=303 RepID=UPI002B248A7E|nr:hypothetical protein [Pseudomonas putida]
MSNAQAGNIEASHVLDFCNTVVAGGTPILVQHSPLSGKPLKECFTIVPEHVAGHGGRQLTGWSIWEFPGKFIEAEFHAIWEDPEGRKVDLTPRPFAVEQVLFLEDLNREYTGRQVDNIRKALVNNFYVTRYLKLHRRIFEILNEGDLADQHGAITLPPAAEREYREVEKEVLELQRRLFPGN